MKLDKLLPDLPCAFPTLPLIFSERHEFYVEKTSGWGVAATRRKIITAFWLNIALSHFARVLLAGLLVVLLLSKTLLSSAFVAFLPFSVLMFFLLLLTMYWPVYYLEFLPRLDAAIENYRRDEIEGIQRCKKEQYSVVSLMLIQHVFVQLSGLPAPPMNTDGAALLSKQYGVSVKSVAPALQLIQRADWNRKSIRKRTEITDDFETAKEYFRQLKAEKAIQLLDKLQMKVLQ